jgi:hypothetical protein
MRWVMKDFPPIDVNQIKPVDMYHSSIPCRRVGKPTGRIAFDGDDGATSALLTPPG